MNFIIEALQIAALTIGTGAGLMYIMDKINEVDKHDLWDTSEDEA